MYHEPQILGIALVPDGNVLRILNAAGKTFFSEHCKRQFCALPPGLFLAYAVSEFPAASTSEKGKLHSDTEFGSDTDSHFAWRQQRKLEKRLSEEAFRFRLAVPPILDLLPFQLEFQKPVRVGDAWLIKPENVREELLSELGRKIFNSTGISASEGGMTEAWPKFGFFLGYGVTPPAVDAFSFRKMSAILYAIEPWDEGLTGGRWKILASARRMVGKPAKTIGL
ncbi:MAG: hypothetical protein LWX00_10365 [Spirochaetia bacterium]|nr:hypothetical protein [Spirochaetia bacterium]